MLRIQAYHYRREKHLRVRSAAPGGFKRHEEMRLEHLGSFSALAPGVPNLAFFLPKQVMRAHPETGSIKNLRGQIRIIIYSLCS